MLLNTYFDLLLCNIYEFFKAYCTFAHILCNSLTQIISVYNQFYIYN